MKLSNNRNAYRNKLLALGLSFSMALALFSPTYILADTQTDLDEANENAEEARTEKAEMMEKLEEKQAELDAITEEIDGLQAEIDAKQAEIDEMIVKINDLRRSIDDQKGSLGNRLRNMYKSGSVGMFDVLLDSNNFSEFLSNMNLVQRIYDSDQKTLMELEEKHRNLEQALADLEVAKQELDATMAIMEEKQAIAEEAKAEVEAAVAEIQARIDEYEAEAARLEIQLAEEQAEIQRQLEAARAAAEAAAAEGQTYEGDELYRVLGNDDSGYIWPCSGPLTSYFGYRNDVQGVGSSNHGGIDIGVATGTPIYASKSGYVSGLTGWYGGYGLAVVINHADGITTVYGHNSQLAVGAGQFVEQGQLIAYAGSTGWSTGPHCHFEMRVNGVPVDPLNYL